MARSLEFAPAIERMADRIVDKIAKSAHGFNAVHLRIEKDARDWSQIMGGPEVGVILLPQRPSCSCCRSVRRAQMVVLQRTTKCLSLGRHL